jgi:hypothetical protein
LGRVKSEIEENILNYGLEKNNTYSVVIIITDGYCHDMEHTKSLLVDLSRMPFSGIVVGLGDSEFADMEVLDADDMILTDSKGRTAARDVIQLVKYNDFKNMGMRELALQVLDELPD